MEKGAGIGRIEERGVEAGGHGGAVQGVLDLGASVAGRGRGRVVTALDDGDPGHGRAHGGSGSGAGDGGARSEESGGHGWEAMLDRASSQWITAARESCSG